jgi:hypothetical protein
MTAQSTYNCDDFGSANPDFQMGLITASAVAACARRDLPSYMQNAWMQGYIHAARGSDPAPGDSLAYSLGFRAGEHAAFG